MSFSPVLLNTPKDPKGPQKTPNGPQRTPKDPKGGPLGSFGGPSGSFGGPLGVLWDVLWGPLGSFGVPWGPLGSVGVLWGPLGVFSRTGEKLICLIVLHFHISMKNILKIQRFPKVCQM